MPTTQTKTTIKIPTNGFSLIEVVIAMTISIILLMITVSTYYINQKTYQKNDTRAELSQNGRVILDRLARELRQTQDIITVLPTDDSDPDALPNYIEFQDGHNTSKITYIKYRQTGQNIERIVNRYYFNGDQATDVHQNDLDQYGNLAIKEELENEVIGEFVSDIEFWGDGLVNIKLDLAKGAETTSLITAIHGRNN